MGKWYGPGGTAVVVCLVLVIPANGLFFPDFTHVMREGSVDSGNSQSRRETLRSNPAVDRPSNHYSYPDHSYYPHNYNIYSYYANRACEPPAFDFCVIGAGECDLPYTYVPPPVRERIDKECEWKMVFKAVRGNGRVVYDDFLQDGDINGDMEAAKDLKSEFVYRDGNILDRWQNLIISQVKMEVFDEGERVMWFLFDGLGSLLNTWMSQERLIASPYADLKSDNYPIFSVDGVPASDRRFYISEVDGAQCYSDCAVFVIADSSSSKCPWEAAFDNPVFIYKTTSDSCGVIQDEGDVHCGDRFVISVKVCNVDNWLQ